MKCATCQNKLIEFINEELSPGKSRRVERHLKNCEACRDEFQELKSALTDARSVMEIETPPARLNARIMAAAKYQSDTFIPRKPFPRFHPLPAVVAAAACVLIFATIYIDRTGTPSEIYTSQFDRLEKNPPAELRMDESDVHPAMDATDSLGASMPEPRDREKKGSNKKEETQKGLKIHWYNEKDFEGAVQDKNTAKSSSEERRQSTTAAKKKARTIGFADARPEPEPPVSHQKTVARSLAVTDEDMIALEESTVGIDGALQEAVISEPSIRVRFNTADNVRPPVMISQNPPRYPAALRAQKIEGAVSAVAIISTTGTVKNIQVLEATHHMFEEALLEAMKTWKYSPGVLDGDPVEVEMRVQASFSLE